ncbi:type II toxin-antitoxin system death-on-curing family toxin [Myxosarcina sp. GI1]|uniref:type II toxin-antitoxin system death-on-curing family toxin n=1 Tax=Myxosarcina sp. GI1 TaxID=1541065 RepID=UPI0005660AC3|nr:type II toxin-antitoxin system death-on-curing family toxin [Myxosarcina sp. GI1]
MNLKFVTLAQAKAIHKQQLALFGGTTGIINEGKLESALYRPVNIANYNPDASIYDLAAALGYGIAINHPFVDGNKRTAFIVMAVFLEINQIKMIASEVEVVNIMIGIASGTTSEEMLCNWLKENTEKYTCYSQL